MNHNAPTDSDRIRALPACKPLVIAVALALAIPHAVFAAPPPVRTLPAGESFAGTGTSAQVTRTLTETQSILTVNQQSDKAIINWDSFSIGSQAAVVFQQPSATSVALNRVNGTEASSIYGSLTANGKVFLVNNNGVLFGQGANVNVGSLVASTLALSDTDFANGNYHFSGDALHRTVANEGTLTAFGTTTAGGGNNGTIALLGGTVSNTGTITARLGTVALAGGDSVTLDFNGDGLTRVVVNPAAVATMVSNGSALVADGGQVIMSANSAGDLASSIVQSGTMRARSLVERNGKLILEGGDGTNITVTGSVDASGLAMGRTGGEVAVNAGRIISLEGAATVDVRGDVGGGTVVLGKSAGATDASAVYTGIDTNATIRADAIRSGNGGQVTLASYNSVFAQGSISATGGTGSGNGGSILIDSYFTNVAGFRADASAGNGVAGTWSLATRVGSTYENYVIDADTATAIGQTLGTGTSVQFSATSGGMSVASGIVKSSGSTATLTLNAAADIVIENDVAIHSSSGRLDVNLNASSSNEGGSIVMNPGAAIRSNGGNITLYGGSDSVNGYAVGGNHYLSGVLLNGATLDSRINQTDVGESGSILLRGAGARFIDATASPAGIVLQDATLHSGSGAINLLGYGGTGLVSSHDWIAGTGIDIATTRAGTGLYSTYGGITLNGHDGSYGVGATYPSGTGVNLNLAAGTGITSTNSDIRITGNAIGSGSTGAAISGTVSAAGLLSVSGVGQGGAAYGLFLRNASLRSTDGGTVRMAGLADTGLGVSMQDVTIDAMSGTSGAGNVVIAGESSGTGVGVAFDGVTIGAAAMQGNVSISALNRALATTLDASMLTVASRSPTTITTGGIINFRPGGVTTGAATTEAFDVPITVGAGSDAFRVTLSDFGIGNAGAARVVIGSAEQSGAITYSSGRALNGSLTLQNDGVNSKGIAIRAPLAVSGLVTLSSGGAVISAAAITAAGVLLHGARSASSFQLTNAGNAVGTVAAIFDNQASTAPNNTSVNFANTGALAIGALAGDGWSTVSQARSRFDAVNSNAAGNVVISTTGPLTLAQNLSSGSGNIRLVTGTVFNNANSKTLQGGAGGDWQIYADTWVGETRGGLAGALPLPNYYNCTYLAACSASLTGNKFVYRTQPTVTLAGASQTRIYGDANPALTYTTNGLINGDTAATSLAGGFATAAISASNVGTYATTGTFTSPSNYLVQVVPGALTIDRAALLVTAVDKTKVYGDAEPLLTVTYTGFTGADTSAVLSGLQLATTTGAAATAGTHAINASGATAQNYTVAYQPGTLTVNKALLTAIADNNSKVYGDADPALTSTLTGLRYNDTADVIAGLQLATTTGAAATAGAHAIDISGATAQNYIVAYQPGTLTVSKALLTAIADNKSKVYGDADPALTATFSGLRYNDTADVIAGLQLATTTGAAATAGTHAIDISGAAAQNYTVAYQPGTLTVNKALLTAIADNKSKVYGDADPALTATFSGLRYNDTAGVITRLQLTTTTGAAATAGKHIITAGNAAAANYVVQYTPGVLSVAQAALTYNAAPATQFVGAPTRTYNGTVAGFVYGDTIAGATTGTLAFTTAATSASPAGTYAIEGSGLSAANYRFIQAPSNASVLLVQANPVVTPGVSPIAALLASVVSDRPTVFRNVTFENSDVYTNNMGVPRVCVATGSLAGGALAADDTLGLEWSRVKVSPNLSNCLTMGQRSSCSDF